VRGIRGDGRHVSPFPSGTYCPHSLLVPLLRKNFAVTFRSQRNHQQCQDYRHREYQMAEWQYRSPY
jgi:hypothetical protein